MQEEPLLLLCCSEAGLISFYCHKHHYSFFFRRSIVLNTNCHLCCLPSLLSPVRKCVSHIFSNEAIGGNTGQRLSLDVRKTGCRPSKQRKCSNEEETACVSFKKHQNGESTSGLEAKNSVSFVSKLTNSIFLLLFLPCTNV